MADVPFYTQGTATGGLLDSLQNQQASQQSASGYVPGQGQAPLLTPGISGVSNAATNAANYTGLTEWERNKMASIASGNDNFMIDSFMSSIASKATPGGAADPKVMASGTPTTQSDPWLSPDEMRDELNALQTRGGTPYGGSSGSGGGGGGGGGAGGAIAGGGSGGLNLSGTQGNAPTGSTPDSLNQYSAPRSNTLGYQNSQSGVPGYTAPGSTNSGGQVGVLQMQQANPQGALDQYKNTPGYQLLNAPGAYEQSPGYQYAMDQSMNQVQNAASAKGMLESGAVIKNMQQTASGLAQQDYGNWWNRQNQLYGDYQNRLQGMAGGPTGGADAMAAGANAAQANLQTGSNLGSLFGNQGTTGMGGIINTAAAQSGNMINAGQQQATVNAANQATQLAGATLGQQQARGIF